MTDLIEPTVLAHTERMGLIDLASYDHVHDLEGMCVRDRSGQCPAPKHLQTHVITFSGVGIRDGWIEVKAKSEAIVRRWAEKEYGRYSTTYPDWDFPAEVQALYPLGCLGRTTLGYDDASHVR
jgi:hypothetical protein